jgi:hypothetical protein
MGAPSRLLPQELPPWAETADNARRAENGRYLLAGSHPHLLSPHMKSLRLHHFEDALCDIMHAMDAAGIQPATIFDCMLRAHRNHMAERLGED